MRINPKRIEDARLAADMSRADLAYAIRRASKGTLKATERGIRGWERDEYQPSAAAIAAIAEATSRDIESFYVDDFEEAAPVGGRFRNGGSAGGPGRADRGKRPGPDSGDGMRAA